MTVKKIVSCEICQGQFTHAITDVVGKPRDRGFCENHFQEFAENLAPAFKQQDFVHPRDFRLRAVVFLQNQEGEYWLELQDSRFFRMTGGLCESALLRHAALNTLPTIHAKLPDLLSPLNVELQSIEVNRFDTAADGAIMRFSTPNGELELETRQTDAIAIAHLTAKPMRLSQSLHEGVNWDEWNPIHGKAAEQIRV